MRTAVPLGTSITELLLADPQRTWTTDTVAQALDAVWRYDTIRSMLGHLAREGVIYRMGRGRFAGDSDAHGVDLAADVDPVTVERLCSTQWPSPPSASTTERTEAVRRMAGWGLTDGEIAARVGGLSVSGVQALRARNGIERVAA